MEIDNLTPLNSDNISEPASPQNISNFEGCLTPYLDKNKDHDTPNNEKDNHYYINEEPFVEQPKTPLFATNNNNQINSSDTNSRTSLGMSQYTYAEDNYWNEFYLTTKLCPKSTHGRIILPWNSCYNNYDINKVKYLLPPNVSEIHIKSLLDGLQAVANYNPLQILSCRKNVLYSLMALVCVIIPLVVVICGALFTFKTVLMYFLPTYVI